MNPAEAQQLRSIFDEAAERPEGERPDFVHAACSGNVELEREVLSLLKALNMGPKALESDVGMWFLEGDTRPVEATPESLDKGPPPNLDGVIVGDFRLIRPIGKGAMGSVYEAEQISVKRRVAVKLLQSWTASRDLRRRFIEESAILARLTHPGIAHVIGAGTRKLELSGPDQALAAGIFDELHSVPWIAMELVDGARTILDWSRGREMQEIVGLFAAVCNALHHGHQQGIIHRDLKPANILVNADGEPKIIDFGIARATNQHTEAASGNTRTGTMLGSPRYMSPEQCEGRGTAVDIRSDVYALGVVLYEALTEVMPYDVDDTAIAACVRTICQTPAADPRSVAPRLPKDLAAVMLKSLTKAPEDRYQSAFEFAADLRRVLAREPVSARQTPWVYRAFLFARRRPVMSAMAFVAMLGVAAGVVGISVGLANERIARRAADREAWLANLTAADSYLRDGNGGMARRRLEAIPESRRGWEWRLLYAKSDTSASVWQMSSAEGRSQISPRGTMVVSFTIADQVATVYDISTRKVLSRISGMLADGRCAWSPDERRIAFTRGTELVVADPRSGEILQHIPTPADGYAIGPGWSPDGTMIVTGTTAPLGVMVFKVDTGECVFKRPSDIWIFDAQFSPDGRTIAWCGERGIEIVDTHSWTNIHTIPVPRPAQHEQGWLAFSPDGHTLALGYGRDGYLIDPAAGTIRAVLRGHTQRIHFVSFDDTGTRLLTTSIDRTVRVWNVANGSPGLVLLGHEAPTFTASFIRGAASHEPSIVSVGMDNRVRWWIPDAGTPVFTAQIDECTRHIAQLEFSTDQSLLEVAGENAYAVVKLSPFPALSQVRSTDLVGLRKIPTTPTVVRQGNPSGVVCERFESGERVWEASCTPLLGGLFVSPSGDRVAVRQSASLLLLDARNGNEYGRCSTAHPVHTAVFSHSGEVLATQGFEGELNIWDARTGALIEPLAPVGDRGLGFSWNADASWLAYCHANDGVTIWDRYERRVVARIDNIGGTVFSLALSPDGKRLAVGAQDRICHIFDIPSGDEVLQLRDHVGTVMCAAWSPDGQTLATGGYDKRVIVYRASSITEQASSQYVGPAR